MRSRVSPSSNGVRRFITKLAAALILLIMILAAAFLYTGSRGFLVLEDVRTGETIARYRMKTGDGFSIGFIHSVNKSPVTDYYELNKDGIYVVKTIYYNYGAGVQTQLEGNEKLEYGDDGSMIITGFDQKMNDLIYFVGTVSDHTLVLNEKTTISLRELCGRNAMVRFRYENGGT